MPFTELCFDLAVDGGYVGMITANSFMKREFGKKLIEEFLAKRDLTHVIDTAGAYIPGHGTPTVILFGRNRRPPAGTAVRAVLGIRGEPSTPANPARGRVWSSIARHTEEVGYEDEFVSVADVERGLLGRHPWSLGGGGAADLRTELEARAVDRLGKLSDSIGVVVVMREDDAFFAGSSATRLGIPAEQERPCLEGIQVRDWLIEAGQAAIWPYDPSTLRAPDGAHRDALEMVMWPWRSLLRRRVAFGKSQEERGLAWFEYSMLFGDRERSDRLVVFPKVSTHNHFALYRGGMAPIASTHVIKLPPDATEDDHLALLGLLNSSTACFWMKQVFQAKAGSGIGRGIQPEAWMDRYEFDGTKLQAFPLIDVPSTIRPLATALDSGARELADAESVAGLPPEVVPAGMPVRTEAGHRTARARLIALQEELDWAVYAAYGLLDESLTYDGEPPPVELGQRAFEIVLARRVRDGEIETAWFERHGATPTTEIPADWPAAYRALIQRRIDAIERSKWIGLVEQPEYKRRWLGTPWAKRVAENARRWLLDRLETPRYFPHADREAADLPPPAMVSCAELADIAARDAEFMAVAQVYRGRDDFDVVALVTELVLDEAVPDLPVLRYKPSGLRKRAQWEKVWEMQRAEDRGEDPGPIPVPPKYTSGDFKSSTFWRLRGKLDVPKERFTIYPYANRETDPTPLVTWAGLDHLQRAQALVACYNERKERDGWTPEQLTPFLASLDQLVPWLLQWHDAPDPVYGDRMGQAYRDFLHDEAHALGLTLEAIRAWTPPSRPRGRRKAVN